MNSFSRQGKALPIKVREEIIEKWLAQTSETANFQDGGDQNSAKFPTIGTHWLDKFPSLGLTNMVKFSWIARIPPSGGKH